MKPLCRVAGHRRAAITLLCPKSVAAAICYQEKSQPSSFLRCCCSNSITAAGNNPCTSHGVTARKICVTSACLQPLPIALAHQLTDFCNAGDKGLNVVQAHAPLKMMSAPKRLKRRTGRPLADCSVARVGVSWMSKCVSFELLGRINRA